MKFGTFASSRSNPFNRQRPTTSLSITNGDRVRKGTPALRSVSPVTSSPASSRARALQNVFRNPPPHKVAFVSPKGAKRRKNFFQDVMDLPPSTDDNGEPEGESDDSVIQGVSLWDKARTQKRPMAGKGGFFHDSGDPMALDDDLKQAPTPENAGFGKYSSAKPTLRPCWKSNERTPKARREPEMPAGGIVQEKELGDCAVNKGASILKTNDPPGALLYVPQDVSKIHAEVTSSRTAAPTTGAKQVSEEEASGTEETLRTVPSVPFPEFIGGGQSRVPVEQAQEGEADQHFGSGDTVDEVPFPGVGLRPTCSRLDEVETGGDASPGFGIGGTEMVLDKRNAANRKDVPKSSNSSGRLPSDSTPAELHGTEHAPLLGVHSSPEPQATQPPTLNLTKRHPWIPTRTRKPPTANLLSSISKRSAEKPSSAGCEPQLHSKDDGGHFSQEAARCKPLKIDESLMRTSARGKEKVEKHTNPAPQDGPSSHMDFDELLKGLPDGLDTTEVHLVQILLNWRKAQMQMSRREATEEEFMGLIRQLQGRAQVMEATMQTMRTRCESLAKQADSLACDLEFWRMQSRNSQSERSALEKALSEQRDMLEGMAREHGKASKALEERLCATVESLQQKTQEVGEFTARISGLEEVQKAIRDEKELLVQELKAAQDLKSKLENEVASLRASEEESKGAATRMSQSNDRLTKRVAELENDLERSHRKLLTSQGQMDEKCASLQKEAEIARRTLQDSLQDVERKLENESAQYRAQEAKQQALLETMTNSVVELQKHQNDLSVEHVNEVKSLAQRLDQEKTKYNNLQQEFEKARYAWNIEQSRLESSANSLSSELHSLKASHENSVSDLTTRCATLEVRLNSADESLVKLREVLAVRQKELEMSISESEELRSNIREIGQERDEALSQMREDSRRMEEENEGKLSKALESYRTELLERTERIRDLDRQLSDLREVKVRLEQVNKEKEQLEAASKNLKYSHGKEIERLRAALRDAQIVEVTGAQTLTDGEELLREMLLGCSDALQRLSGTQSAQDPSVSSTFEETMAKFARIPSYVNGLLTKYQTDFDTKFAEVVSHLEASGNQKQSKAEEDLKGALKKQEYAARELEKARKQAVASENDFKVELANQAERHRKELQQLRERFQNEVTLHDEKMLSLQQSLREAQNDRARLKRLRADEGNQVMKRLKTQINGLEKRLQESEKGRADAEKLALCTNPKSRGPLRTTRSGKKGEVSGDPAQRFHEEDERRNETAARHRTPLLETGSHGQTTIITSPTSGVGGDSAGLGPSAKGIILREEPFLAHDGAGLGLQEISLHVGHPVARGVAKGGRWLVGESGHTPHQGRRTVTREDTTEWEYIFGM